MYEKEGKRGPEKAYEGVRRERGVRGKRREKRHERIIFRCKTFTFF